MRILLFPVILLGSAILCVAQKGANWNYEGHTGPLVWAKLDPSYQACGKGHEQSPLDIRGAHLNKALTPLEFHYIAGPMTLENTGRGIVAHVDRGSWMEAAGVRYALVELDFHHPGEHPVKGRLSDMEVDLVHRSEDGKEAIVAVRLNQDRGNPNALLATLWDHLPRTAGATARVADMVSAGGLLPGDRGYWTYVGSELTPPCAEGVRWFVFEEDMSISRSQVHIFESMFKLNTRPVQDAHGRKIEANE
jgi:carbonic anhydrase